MLRRPPTSITLTADDIDAYERARLHRLQQDQLNQQAAAAAAASSTTSSNPLANPNLDTTAIVTNSFSSSSMSPGPAGASAANVGFEAGGGAIAADTDGSRGGDGGGRRAPGDIEDGLRPSAVQESERARTGRTREERIMGARSGADIAGRRAGAGGGMGRG